MWFPFRMCAWGAASAALGAFVTVMVLLLLTAADAPQQLLRSGYVNRATACRWAAELAPGGGNALVGYLLRQVAMAPAADKQTALRQCLAAGLHGSMDDGVLWAALGDAGGGDVAGLFATPVACYERAVAANPDNGGAWLRLAAAGGGTVSGTRYTAKAAAEYAAEHWPAEPMAWYVLAAEGGGTVDLERHTREDARQRAKRAANVRHRAAQLVRKQVRDLVAKSML
jgi:hypothetical protein